MIYAIPLRHIIIDRDVIHGGTFSFVTNAPLMIPIQAPAKSGIKIAAATFTLHILAAIIPHTATIEPTERSIHPVMITNVIPTAMTPIILD